MFWINNFQIFVSSHDQLYGCLQFKTVYISNIVKLNKYWQTRVSRFKISKIDVYTSLQYQFQFPFPSWIIVSRTCIPKFFLFVFRLIGVAIFFLSRSHCVVLKSDFYRICVCWLCLILYSVRGIICSKLYNIYENVNFEKVFIPSILWWKKEDIRRLANSQEKLLYE